MRPLPNRPASASPSRCGLVGRPPTVPQRAACRPRLASPSCRHVRCLRGRARRDPHRLRSWRRAIGRSRAAPVVPGCDRQCAGSGMRPDYCWLETPAREAPAGQAIAFPGGLIASATWRPGPFHARYSGPDEARGRKPDLRQPPADDRLGCGFATVRTATARPKPDVRLVARTGRYADFRT